jgi:xylulokinase
MVLACDIGTTILKTAIIDIKGKLLSFSKVRIVALQGAATDYTNSEPLRWIMCLKEAILRLSGIKRKHIRAIVVSGNGPTLIPVGGKGIPLSPALTWQNMKGADLAEMIKEKTGNTVEPSYYLGKAYWLFKNMPHIYEKVCHFLPCPEYINYFLTGNARIILPAPDYIRYMWSSHAIEKLGMETEKFPPFVEMGEEVGRVCSHVSRTLGIPAGIPVFAGGPDFIMSLLGTATVREGQTCDRTGTSEGINHCSGRAVKEGKLLCFPHISKGLYNISAILHTSGKAIDWFLRLIKGNESDLEQLYIEFADLNPGADNIIVLPHFAGARTAIWDVFSRGVVIGLTAEHSRAHIFRAIVESIGYAVREIIEVMEEYGYHIDEMRVSGAQAKVKEWNQVRANITGKTILVPEVQDAELMGCACVGFSGLGDYTYPVDAAEQMVNIAARFPVEKKIKIKYDLFYELYKKSYQKLKDIFRQLGN